MGRGTDKLTNDGTDKLSDVLINGQTSERTGGWTKERKNTIQTSEQTYKQLEIVGKFSPLDMIAVF